MNTDDFEKAFEEQVERCREVLVNKAREYATEDRLHNFKVAAALQGISPEAALAGFLAKHIVSIFDMTPTPKSHSRAQWDEKITDALNYLFLLNAIIKEEN